VKKVLGTIVVLLGMLGGGFLVFWNIFGMAPYGDRCNHSVGCKSFYCLHHQLSNGAQVPSPGHCTKSCDSDGDCDTGAVCVTLSEDSRDDLPPLGKPDKACILVAPGTAPAPR